MTPNTPKINDGGPAFPSPAEYRQSDGCLIRYATEGMSLRAYFAGQVLAGMLGNPSRSGTPEKYARLAVRHADALIAELAKVESSQ